MLVERLRELREDADLTQKTIAEYLQLPTNTYGNYETDRREIPLNILIKLADYYNINLDYLVGRTDERHLLPPSKRKKT